MLINYLFVGNEDIYVSLYCTYKSQCDLGCFMLGSVALFTVAFSFCEALLEANGFSSAEFDMLPTLFDFSIGRIFAAAIAASLSFSLLYELVVLFGLTLSVFPFCVLGLGWVPFGLTNKS
jgi:hypothetical protein